MKIDVDQADGNTGGSVVRLRMIAVIACAFVTGLALSGITVILPLYATRTLKLSNAGYARVLSLRMIGITVGVILLGALSDRFGNKRLTIGCLAVGGVAYGLLGFVPFYGFLILIPVASALLSTSFVNLNYLTQIVDPHRQGRANTMYRSAGTLAGILAPVIVTRWLSSAAWVFAGTGASLCAGAIVLRIYPITEPREAFGGLARELSGIINQYRLAVGERHLMRFVNVSLMMAAACSSVGTFLAIRLTAELKAPAEWYGGVCSAGSALSLFGIVALGAVLDRVKLKSCFLVLSGLTAVSMVAMGLTSSTLVTAICFIIFTVVSTVTVAPISMWISRESGSAGLGSAFSVHKVLSAAYAAAAVFLFSLVEPVLGIGRLLVLSGLLAGLMVVGSAFLRTPPSLMSRNGKV